MVSSACRYDYEGLHGEDGRQRQECIRDSQSIVASNNEKERIDKGVQALAADGVLVPFVVKSYGTMGQAAHQFVSTMAQEIIDITRRSSTTKMVAALRAEIVSAVAVALHRGNSACLHRGLVSSVATWAG